MSSSIARSAQHILSHTPVSSKVVKVHRNKSHFDEGNTVVESNENTEDVSDASSSTKLSASTNIKFSREFSVKENLLLNSKSTTSVLPAIINESPRSARSIDEQTISPRVQLPSIVHISINGSMSGLQDLEKKELQEALEILMMQNKMLASRIEKSQIESQQQLETEKRKRLADVSRLSDEKSVLNRQLMEAQEVAEKKLEKEKEELLMVIRKMEQERRSYEEQIRQSEDEIRAEAGLLRMQRAELEEKMKRLEQQRDELSLRWKQNEILSHQQGETQGADINNLSRQQKELQETLRRVEKERDYLAEMMQEAERRAQKHTVALVTNLEDEKRKMAEVLKRMESEKAAQAQKVLVTKESTANIALAISQQIERDRAEARASLEELETQRKQIADQVNASGGGGGSHALGESSLPKLAMPSKKADREALISKLKEMAKKKEKIEGKVNVVEESKALQERIKLNRKLKAKEDLKLSVQKMRSDIVSNHGQVAEKNVQKDALKATKDSIMRMSFKSLYEVMGGAEAEGAGAGRGSTHSEEQSYSIVRFASYKPHSIAQPLGHFANHPRNVKISSGTDPNQSVQAGEDSAFDIEDLQSQKRPEVDALLLLPAPHAAAGKGDMQSLQQLQKRDKNLLNSFEQTVGRRPLFYAACHGRKEALVCLLELFPTAKDIMAADLHGDTALHAAAASGHAECVELIVQMLRRPTESDNATGDASKPPHGATSGDHQNDVNVRNSMGMTPCHLALNDDCLEVLYRYDANLCVEDDDHRSPLFVACAMNRQSCAEFIIGCLDQIDASLIAKDRRGDTPLHAAACNGSMECLLLLLQYGIDPRMLNIEGLKAIDLAEQNGHEECKQILSEYYLHYCTSSEFDSVLFFAALKGHDFVLQERAATAAYKIIRKAVDSRSFGLGDKKESMFSLRGGKTLRMEKWGCWIAYHDPHSHQVYWYNHETTTGQWQTPPEVLELKSAASKNADGFDKTLKSKMSMRLKKVGEWIQYRTSAGKTFYYNQDSGEFQWDSPDARASSSGSQHRTQTQTQSQSEWKPYLDEASGSVFWYNHTTQVSQWECPANLSADSEQDHSKSSKNDKDYFYQDDIFEVQNENELGI